MRAVERARWWATLRVTEAMVLVVTTGACLWEALALLDSPGAPGMPRVPVLVLAALQVLLGSVVALEGMRGWAARRRAKAARLPPREEAWRPRVWTAAGQEAWIPPAALRVTPEVEEIPPVVLEVKPGRPPRGQQA